MEKLHYGELNDLYCSPTFVRVIKSRIMRWAEHAARMGERGGVYWWENLWERDYLGDPDVDGRIILIWIFRKWDGGMEWIELARDRDRWRALLNAVMNHRAP